MVVVVVVGTGYRRGGARGLLLAVRCTKYVCDGFACLADEGRGQLKEKEDEDVAVAAGAAGIAARVVCSR